MPLSSLPNEQTVTLPTLLDGDSDADFPQLIVLLYAMSGRLQLMPRDLAKAPRVRVAEFPMQTALMYLGHHKERIRVRTAADHLRVSDAQVTATVSNLHSSGWVNKVNDPKDSRTSPLTLTDQTRLRFTAFAPHFRTVNDRWFDGSGCFYAVWSGNMKVPVSRREI